MGLLKWTAILFVPVVIGVYIALHGCCRSPPILPNMADGWWGRGLEQDSDNSTVIRPIIVTVGITARYENNSVAYASYIP